MKHLMHLLLWDARRLRFIIAIWLVVVAAGSIVTGVRPLVAADPSMRESMAVLTSLLWLTTMMLTFAMVSFVVHGDPAVGSDAFWMTRPIPPLSLLASKLVLLGLALVAAPAIADAILVVANKMPAAIAAGVVAESASSSLVVIVVLAAAAALTRNLPRFLLLCGTGAAALAAALGLLIAIEMARTDEAPPVSSDGRGGDPTSFVVFNLVLVTAAVAMLAVQYRTRLRKHSIAMGTAGVFAAYGVASIWPVPFLARQLVVPQWPNQSSALKVSVEPATISTNVARTFFREEISSWSTVNGVVRIDSLEPGWTADVRFREPSVRLTNGVTLRSPGAWMTTALLAGEADPDLQRYIVARDILGVTRVGHVMPPRVDPRPPETLPVLLVMRRRELAAHVPARGLYHADVDVLLTHDIIDGIITIQPGAVHHTAGYRLVIDRVTRSNGEVAIGVRETRASSMWERRPWALYTFYLRNQDRREAIALSDYELGGGFSLLRFLPLGDISFGSSHTGSGFVARARVLNFPPRYSPRAETVAVDDAWLDGAELVIVCRTQEGSVERTLDIPDFPIGTPRRAPS